MGLLDKIFNKPTKQEAANITAARYFELLDGYSPVFTTYEGGVYEMELTRACINAFATHCMKLQPNIQGPDRRNLKALLNGKPNPYMTASQFLYKVATILSVTNTCYIIPILDKLDRLCGYYPINPAATEVVEVNGEAWLRYTFRNGQRAAIEFAKVGALYNFQYKSDFRGETNAALTPTMQLITTQREGISNGIKNSAAFRFMATLNNFVKAEDVKKERKKFTDQNFSSEDGGLLLFPNNYSNVQQIRSEANIVDAEQMKIIETRVFDYFGCNEDILQNKTVGDKWSAYYEGKIEPFAIQLSQALTAMSYTAAEQARDNAIVYSSNRLQYMTNADKLNVSSQMFDRGVMSLNDIMDIWNLPHVEGGEKRYIRKEYTEVSKLDAASEPAAPAAQEKPEPAAPADDKEQENNSPADDTEAGKKGD